MSDPTLLIALATTGTAAIAIGAAAGLKAWEDWLELRKAELGSRHRRSSDRGPIELLALRDRVRRLEAIANGGQR